MCWRFEAFSSVAWELEGAMERTAELAAAAALEQPLDKPTVTTKNVTKVLWTALFESR